MIKFFCKPDKMVKEMKKYSYLMSLFYLLLTAIILFFTAKVAGLTWLNSLYVLLGVIVTIILGAFSLNIIMWVWGKQNYMLSLNVLVGPWFIMASGAFIMSVLGLIPSAGPILAGLVTMIVMPFAIALQLRLVSEAFKLDMLTTVVILFILYIGAGAAIMSIVSGLALQLVSALGFGLLPIAFP